jgi:cytidylate kinase
MKSSLPLTITISRQLGSGGAYIGQQLAKRLNISYYDREIISKAAGELSVSEEDLETLDEKKTSKVKSILQLCPFGVTDTYIPPQIYIPTDRELFKAEAQIIEHIYNEGSSVIIGRCGSYILRGKPNHISIFLHANTDFRRDRIHKLYKMALDSAEKYIKKSDTERRDYNMKFSKVDWADLNNYDLTIDTGKIDFDDCVELIIRYIEISQKE